MGAHLVTRTFKQCSRDDLTKLYAAAVADDRSEFGTDAYSGTWAAKRGGLDFPFGDRIVSRSEADKSMDDNDKWGSSYAIKVAQAKNGDELKAQGDALWKEELALASESASTFSFPNSISARLVWTPPTGDEYETPASREANKASRETVFKSAGLKAAWIRIVTTSTSQFRGCRDCESRISMVHMKKHINGGRFHCPVCMSPQGFMTEGDIEKTQKLASKLIDRSENLTDRIIAHRAAKRDGNKMLDTANWYWLVGGFCPS